MKQRYTFTLDEVEIKMLDRIINKPGDRSWKIGQLIREAYSNSILEK